MPQVTKGRPASKATTFSLRQVTYVLPHMKARELTKIQPDALMAKLSDCNARLPPKKASLEFISAAFNVLFDRIRDPQRKAKWRQVKCQWKASFRAYKARFKKKKSSRPGVQQNVHTPGIQQSVQADHKENVVIDSQNWWLSRRYTRDFRTLGFHNFGSNFISMNQNHPRQDFTPSVLVQAFEAYITRAANISSEIKQEMMQRKNSKRAQTFLQKCGRRAAAAKAQAERKAATCSADSSNSDSETETDGAETRDAADISAEATEDDMQEVVPAADNTPASTSIESEAEGRNPDQSSSEDDGDSSSITTSGESESETQEVFNAAHEQMSDGSSDDANYDRMSIDDYREDDKARSRKRRRESTSARPTHDLILSQNTHSPRAKRLRMAKSPTRTRSSPSTEQYGRGRDIFSALMDYLDQFG